MFKEWDKTKGRKMDQNKGKQAFVRKLSKPSNKTGCGQ